MHNIVFQWKVKKISNKVASILKKKPKGKVHSVFNTSFNLIFGNHIIHVGSYEEGLAPFGIGLERSATHRLTKQMTTHSPVVWDEVKQTLRIANNELFLCGASTINHQQAVQSYDYKLLKENFRLLCEELRKDSWKTGLIQVEEEKASILDYLLDKSINSGSHLFDPNLQALLSLIVQEEKDINPILDYWIGRGPGLTPSGDDLMTGICTMLYLLQGNKSQFIKQLDSYLDQYGTERTTQISLEYLLYAARGEFHSHLLDLSNQLLLPWNTTLSNSIAQMKGLGHTSGTDTVIGVLLGMKAVMIHYEDKQKMN